MTGPEHYKEAERLLAEAGVYSAHDGIAVAFVQRAQTHAILALAASQMRSLTAEADLTKVVRS